MPFQLATIQIILSSSRGISLFEGKKLRFIGGATGVTALLIIYIIAPNFFALPNLVNLLRQTAINGIIATGMTILMISGGFDLSVGAMVALSGVLAIHFAQHDLLLGAGIPVLFGGVAGCVNGILVGRFAINPLIVTLGTRYLFYAAANLWTSGFIQYNQNPSFLFIGRSSWLGIPTPGIVFICVALVAHLLLRYSIWGLAIFTVGSNEPAAFFSGVSTHKIQVSGFLVTGVCAALAGVVLASRLGVAAPDAGEGYELDAIAAVVVGGTSLFGGTGSILQTIMGVALLGILSNILVLAGQPYEVQRIVTGCIIVSAVGADIYFRKTMA